MTYGNDSIQLPDGEELVVVERDEWPVASAPDPRETSLNLRRQVGQPLLTHPSPIATTN